MNKLVKQKCILLGIAILLLPLFVFHIQRASALDAGLVDNDINVDLLPENPKPYGDVTITLSSYAVDLNKSMLIWKNGKNTLQSGYGKITYSFKTLGPDMAIVFNISITSPDGSSSLTKTITINPQEVDVLWESVDGYTPPFYRGKSFASSESMIKAVAIPNSTTLGSSHGRVTYTWKNGDNTDLGVSGYGKDAYVFKNSNLNTSENISVLASSVDGNYSATSNLNIPIIDPTLIFYKKSPTEGVLYNSALVNEIPMTDNEATIVGVPYFLATKGHDLDLSYKWQINDNDVTTPNLKNELTIHPTDHNGYATISLAIENTVLLFQKVSSKLQLDL